MNEIEINEEAMNLINQNQAGYSIDEGEKDYLYILAYNDGVIGLRNVLLEKLKRDKND